MLMPKCPCTQGSQLPAEQLQQNTGAEHPNAGSKEQKQGKAGHGMERGAWFRAQHAAAGNGWCRQHTVQSAAQSCRQCLMQAVMMQAPDAGRHKEQSHASAAGSTWHTE